MFLSEQWERTEVERNVSRMLEEVAAEVGAKSIQAGTSRRELLALPDGGRG